MPAVHALCLIPEQTPDHPRIAMLETGIGRLYEEHIGQGSRLRMIWLFLPAGSTYLAGQPANVSAVMLPVPDGLSDAVRHTLMHAINTLWRSVVNDSDLVLNVPDQRYAAAYTRALHQRFHPVLGLPRQLHLVANLLASRWRHGYFGAHLNQD